MPHATTQAGGDVPAPPRPDGDVCAIGQNAWRVVEMAWRICAETPGGCGLTWAPCGWCLAEARAELEARR